MLLPVRPYFFVIHPFPHVIATWVSFIIMHVHRRMLLYICILIHVYWYTCVDPRDTTVKKQLSFLSSHSTINFNFCNHIVVQVDIEYVQVWIRRCN